MSAADVATQLLGSTTPVVYGIPVTGAVIYGIYRVVQQGAKAAAVEAPVISKSIREWFQPAESPALTPSYTPSPVIEKRVAQLKPIVTADGPSKIGAEYTGAFLFISYRRSDSAEAHRLRARLETEGIKVWLDTSEIDAGDRWRLTVQEAIERCAGFVSLMSGDRPSDVIQQEIVWAQRCGKPIFPVSLRKGQYFSLSQLQFEPTSDGTVSTEFARAVKTKIAV